MSSGGVLHVRFMSGSDYEIQFAALLSVTQIRSMFKFIELMPFGYMKFSRDLQCVKISLNEKWNLIFPKGQSAQECQWRRCDIRFCIDELSWNTYCVLILCWVFPNRTGNLVATHSPDPGHCQGDGESVSPPVNYADITPQMIASFFLVFLLCAFQSLLGRSM